jgi:predicted nucleic acid-binding protein
MKNYILKLGILALGTAGLLLLAPKKKEVVETVKSKIKDMKSQVKFEPEKATFC